MNEENKWLSKKDDIATIFLEYFKKVFATSFPTEMEHIFQATEDKIDDERNKTLLREFTSLEIKHALDQMNSNKVLGPDEMTRCFYKKY